MTEQDKLFEQWLERIDLLLEIEQMSTTIYPEPIVDPAYLTEVFYGC